MAKMWDIRRREMHIQYEREKRKKTGNRIFQQTGSSITDGLGYDEYGLQIAPRIPKILRGVGAQSTSTAGVKPGLYLTFSYPNPQTIPHYSSYPGFYTSSNSIPPGTCPKHMKCGHVSTTPSIPSSKHVIP
jgi:hypothetical protein